MLFFLVTFKRGSQYDTQFKLVQADTQTQAEDKFVAWLDKMCEDPEIGFTYERAKGNYEIHETLR
jgi:hypothetical protein